MICRQQQYLRRNPGAGNMCPSNFFEIVGNLVENTGEERLHVSVEITSQTTYAIFYIWQENLEFVCILKVFLSFLLHRLLMSLRKHVILNLSTNYFLQPFL